MKLTSLFPFCIAVFIAGCSSIMTHSGPYNGYYPGVKNNAHMLKEGDMGWAMTPLLIIDTPLSAIADTLLLPYDIYRSKQDTSEVSPKQRVIVGEKHKKQQGQLPLSTENHK